jgi:hypothetical protein
MATSTAICCSRSPTGKAWYQAKKHCERLGEYLASITSDDEQQFPTNRFQFADTNIWQDWLGPWIGYTDGTRMQGCMAASVSETLLAASPTAQDRILQQH